MKLVVLSGVSKAAEILRPGIRNDPKEHEGSRHIRCKEKIYGSIQRGRERSSREYGMVPSATTPLNLAIHSFPP